MSETDKNRAILEQTTHKSKSFTQFYQPVDYGETAMNTKRILLVALSVFGILAVVAAAGFILTSNSSAQADEALSNPPAAVSEQQAAIENEAQYQDYITEQDSLSGNKSYSSEESGCYHDTAIDWSTED